MPVLIATVPPSGVPPSGFYAAGHWTPTRFSSSLFKCISIRPDSETGAFGTTRAPYRLAFYDGANPVQYEWPMVMGLGCSEPFVFQIIAGPAWLNIGGFLGSTNYGVLYGTPTSAISTASPVTVTVRVWDQALFFLDVTYTLATSSSLTDFMFGSPTGNDANSGAITSKKQNLSAFMPTTAGGTTFAGPRVYLDGVNVGTQTYQFPAQSGSAVTGGVGLDRTKNPIVYRSLPGTGNVTIDASVAQVFDTSGGMDDMYFAGSTLERMIINGSAATALDTHTFEIYNANRVGWRSVDFTNPISRANGSLTNSTSTFSFNNSAGGVPGKRYWHMSDCTESGRAAGAGNSMLLLAWFSVLDFAVENSSVAGTAGFGVFFKDSNQNGVFRYGLSNLQPNTSSSGAGFLFGGQQGESPPVTSQNLEICYSRVFGAIKFDFQGGATNGMTASRRNTVYRADTNEPWALGSNAPTGQGPYYTDCDVLVAKSPGGIQTTGSVAFTATGTEVQVPWSGTPPPASNNPINTTTLALVDSTTLWKTLYSKTVNSRGFEFG